MVMALNDDENGSGRRQTDQVCVLRARNHFPRAKASSFNSLIHTMLQRISPRPAGPRSGPVTPARKTAKHNPPLTTPAYCGCSIQPFHRTCTSKATVSSTAEKMRQYNHCGFNKKMTFPASQRAPAHVPLVFAELLQRLRTDPSSCVWQCIYFEEATLVEPHETSLDLFWGFGRNKKPTYLFFWFIFRMLFRTLCSRGSQRNRKFVPAASPMSHFTRRFAQNRQRRSSDTNTSLVTCPRACYSRAIHYSAGARPKKKHPPQLVLFIGV
jgi:hypothetical protein